MKGYGYSRAAKAEKSVWALASEGMLVSKIDLSWAFEELLTERWADARLECLCGMLRQRANVLRPKHCEYRRKIAYGEILDVVLAGLGLRAGVRCEAGNELTYRSRSKLRLVVAARKVIFFAPGSIDAGLARRSEDFVVLERSRRWIDLGDGKGRMIPVDWRDRRDHFDRDTLC